MEAQAKALEQRGSELYAVAFGLAEPARSVQFAHRRVAEVEGIGQLLEVLLMAALPELFVRSSTKVEIPMPIAHLTSNERIIGGQRRRHYSGKIGKPQVIEHALKDKRDKG